MEASFAEDTATKQPVIPEISDKLLAERMERIKFVTQAMQGLDGKVYTTEEEDEKYFDLFYSESSCDPRKEAFNFDENKKVIEKAIDLKELMKTNIFVKIGGFYGFCKITLAEVMSQIPQEIEQDTIAFAINPKESPKIINEDYQSASIIFYGKSSEQAEEISEPSVEGLIKPIDLAKAHKLKAAIKPIINWRDTGYTFIDPEEVNEPFMQVGIWLRVNGSNLHKNNTETQINIPHKLGEKVCVYQPFDDSADFYKPNYAHVISQIADELINENTIGLVFEKVDYFRTKEGVIHKANYTLMEKI